MFVKFAMLMFLLALATRQITLLRKRGKTHIRPTTRDEVLARLRAQRIQPILEKIRERGKRTDREVTLRDALRFMIVAMAVGTVAHLDRVD